MGKQKLTSTKVELIKHLLKETNLSHQQIGSLFHVSRECVTNIKNELRWPEVETPELVRGNLLYYKLLNNELV